MSLSANEEDRSCSCSKYEYALGPTLSSDKVFAIRRRGSEEVEELCLSIDQAHILACKKQATEVLKLASIRDLSALRRIVDSCFELSFDMLHEKLQAYKISTASSSSSSQQMAVYEVIEVAVDAAVSRGHSMHHDAQMGIKGILEEWVAKEKSSSQNKAYRVVCSSDCEVPSNVIYGSKQEAYAAAMLKQAALVRNVSQWDNIVEEREDCLNILEGTKEKPLEEQHRALVKRADQSGLIHFHVEELVFVGSSSTADADAAAAVMTERAASLLRNSEETIYLVKSSPSRFGRSRAAKAIPSWMDTSEDMDKITVIHGAFRDSQEAYSLAFDMQVQNVLQHATDLAHKEHIAIMLGGLAVAPQESREEAFVSLKSWLMDEMIHLKSKTRSFTVQKFVVNSFFEKDNGEFWEEIMDRFDDWEKQFKAEESVNCSVSPGK